MTLHAAESHRLSNQHRADAGGNAERRADFYSMNSSAFSHSNICISIPIQISTYQFIQVHFLSFFLYLKKYLFIVDLKRYEYICDRPREYPPSVRKRFFDNETFKLWAEFCKVALKLMPFSAVKWSCMLITLRLRTCVIWFLRHQSKQNREKV